LRRVKREERTTLIFAVIGAAANLGGSVTDAVTSTNSAEQLAEKEARDEERRNNAIHQQNQVTQAEHNVTLARNSLNNKEQSLLRRTTLFPGQQMSGQVHASRRNKARFITLILETERTKLNWPFEQKEIIQYD
jgi:hypothetical protein